MCHTINLDIFTKTGNVKVRSLRMGKKEFTTSLLGIQGWEAKKVSMNESSGILTIELERLPCTPLACSKCSISYLSIYNHYPMREVEEWKSFRHSVPDISGVFSNPCRMLALR